jgi:hypothetical protein
MLIQDYFPTACEGDMVIWREGGRTIDGMVGGRTIDGMVGEVNGGGFFIWHNERGFDGSRGDKAPSSAGYLYSWAIGKSANGGIDIISSKADLTYKYV